MNREQLKQYIKDNVPCTDYLTPAPNHNGNSGYCCPFCESGTHGPGSTGAVKFYPETNTWNCFACNKGGDVFDLYTKTTGSDFNKALEDLAEKTGLEDNCINDSINGREKPWLKENGAAADPGEPEADYSEYYKLCQGRLNDAALSYLTGRGFTQATIDRFDIGFDPAADPASAPGVMGNEFKAHPTPRIIIPCTTDFYLPRSIDQNTPPAYKTPNPRGSHTKPFFALYDNKPQTVFICEGWADALSIYETGVDAISLNGKSNHKLLFKWLEENPGEAGFIIVPDNDENPETDKKTQAQAAALATSLKGKGYQAIVYNVAGKYHDANDAFTHDRKTFEENLSAAIDALERDSEQIKDPEESPQLNGQLTYEKALEVFKNANDEYISLSAFPEFSKVAKIKLHDSAVIAADTGAGKSSLAINFINNLNSDYPVIYFNLEMDELTILRRLVSINTGIILEKIEGYKNDLNTAAEVNDALKELTARKPLQIIQDKYSLPEIEEEIKQATAGREEPTIVIIDHSLLVTTGEKSTRYERFTQISEELRRISRLNNVIMFSLLQQNRSGKDDESKRPTNSSLKESGSWENDATHIIFLWWDPEERTKKLLLTKNRAGATGEFNLDYNSATQIYREEKPRESGGNRIEDIY